MTCQERVRRLGSLRQGLTDRQAEFLVTVMLHSGWCFQRHYAAYAGIPHGRKIVDFFESLVSRGYATAWPCLQYRARAYHVHYKPLYRAIGEENNRHRRPAPLPRALERMMLLDAVLAHRDGTWLATEEEKVGHFLLSHRIPREDLPALTFRAASGETARFFPDKLPINIDPDGHRYTFLYLVTQDLPIDFRRFLERHAELLRALPAWVVRLMVPVHMTHATPLYQSAFHEHLSTPLRHAVMEELKWYFRARRSQSSDDQQRFDEAAEAFGAPRFQMLYREWLDRGESVLEGTVSTALPDAVARGNGRLECHVSPHKYLHLASLVGTA